MPDKPRPSRIQDPDPHGEPLRPCTRVDGRPSSTVFWVMNINEFELWLWTNRHRLITGAPPNRFVVV